MSKQPAATPVKLALAEIRRLREQLRQASAGRGEPIAIIGMGLRFPGGATDAEQFHAQLCAGMNAIRRVPPERWDADRYFSSDRDAPGKMYTREGGFLEDVVGFDPEFFGISPVEAATIDPQQRLLLEATWEALEDAGIDATSLRGTQTGVYVGVAGSDYGRMSLSRADAIDEYASLGTAFSVAGGRISYVLGLTGPAVSIDTACSASLVALHLAGQALRNGECDTALAAGVNLILSPEVTINFCRAGMLAPDGQCKTFDAGADGYVRGEGCAAVVLKRLSDAERNGDRILAVIRGSAINQDGRSSGLTAPNGPSQEAVIRAALRNAGVAASQVGYVEAHGTGTSLGDPIELQALGSVYGAGRPADHPLLVGSVKTNVGHLEAAAGMAGLVKTVQALRSGVIPPHRNFATPNPHVAWSALPLRVPTEATAFERVDGRRRAGLSSFGFSGTNVHVILEEAPDTAARPMPTRGDRDVHMLTLSAAQPDALRDMAERYAQHLDASDDTFGDICATAVGGRAHLRHRLAVVAGDRDAAASALREWLKVGHAEDVCSGDSGGSARPTLVFACGAQAGMTAACIAMLQSTAPVFASSLERSAVATSGLLDAPFQTLLATLDGRAAIHNGEHRVVSAALQIALGELWASWGLHPDVVTGVGAGAHAARVLRGTASLEDALRDAHVGATEPGADTLDDVRQAGPVWIVELAAGAAPGAPRAGDVLVHAPTEAAPWPVIQRGRAQLYVAGADLAPAEDERQRRRVSLPRYAFQRRPYWRSSSGNAATVRADGRAGVRAAIRARAELAPLDLNVTTYHAKWQALDALTRALGQDVLVRLDVFTRTGETATVQEILERGGIATLYRPSIVRWLEALCDAGMLERADEGYRANAPLTRPDLDPLWREVEEQLSDNAPLLAYLANCGELLFDVLVGRASPLETLFPGGGFDLATALYERSAVMRYVNGIAAAAVHCYVEANGGAPLRVLEFGAGTGGTTSSLLPVLPPERTQYEFTDVSDVFLEQAAARFRDYPFVRTGLFDLEKELDAQGYIPGTYDIVIGANVLHAARDLRAALARVHGLLAPGGMLVLVESTGHLAWHDFSTGLIEGWQHFTDGLRSDSPLLPAERWIELLGETGFEAASAAPQADSVASILAQHVIVAHRSAVGERALSPRTKERATEHAVEATKAHDTESDFLVRLRQALPAERVDIAAHAVRACVIDVLHLDPERPPARDARLMDLGVDSLLAVRLRNQMQKRLGLPRKLPATLIFDYPTIGRIANLIVERHAEVEGRDVQARRAQPTGGDRAAELAQLSDAEAEALLLSHLNAGDLS